MRKQSIRTTLDLIQLEIVQEAERRSNRIYDEHYDRWLTKCESLYAQEIASLQEQCAANGGHVALHGFTKCCICDAKVDSPAR